MPPNTSLLFGAAFRDPASISFGESAPESGGFKIPAVNRRSGLLPPGSVQITTVNRVEAKIVNEAKPCCLGVQRIACDRESDPPLRSPRNALCEQAFGEDVVERLDHETPDLLRDPPASCPSLTSWRASILPMLPVQMTPILMIVLLCLIWDTSQTLAARDSFDPTDARRRSTHSFAG